jgi:hypothetical protein
MVIPPEEYGLVLTARQASTYESIASIAVWLC